MFDRANERWTLWLPEMTPGDHPLTPASQVFFPVILRHGPQAIAIRFLYDCSTGKVRYYTSAIPSQIVGLPEFENAVSELFRHSLPVEPMRERRLGRGLVVKPAKPRPADHNSLAEPETTGAMVPAAPPVPLTPVLAEKKPQAIEKISPALAAAPIAAPQPVRRDVRVEIGPRIKDVLLAFIVTTGLVLLVGLSIYAYLQATQDPGVLHHKLQIEEMKLRK